MGAKAVHFNEKLFFFPLSLAFGCRSKFQGAKWHVVALGIRVFLGLLRRYVGVSRGKKNNLFSCC